MTRITDDTLDTIAALGFQVWMSPDPHRQTYLFYTDGTRIGYLQNDCLAGFEVSTVHVPNRTSGTGYRMTDDRDRFTMTRECLERGFAHVPAWAARDYGSVRKYRDMAHFVQSRGSINKLEQVR